MWCAAEICRCRLPEDLWHVGWSSCISWSRPSSIQDWVHCQTEDKCSYRSVSGESISKAHSQVRPAQSDGRNPVTTEYASRLQTRRTPQLLSGGHRGCLLVDTTAQRGTEVLLCASEKQLLLFPAHSAGKSGSAADFLSHHCSGIEMGPEHRCHTGWSYLPHWRSESSNRRRWPAVHTEGQSEETAGTSNHDHESLDDHGLPVGVPQSSLDYIYGLDRSRTDPQQRWNRSQSSIGESGGSEAVAEASNIQQCRTQENPSNHHWEGNVHCFSEILLETFHPGALCGPNRFITRWFGFSRSSTMRRPALDETFHFEASNVSYPWSQ